MSMAVLVREAFEEKNLKYKEFREMPDGATAMVAGFTGQMSTYDIVMIFDKADHTVMLRTGKLAKVPIDRRFDVLTALNELNGEYRWTRFYIDSEDFVTVQTDHMNSAGDSADAVMEIIIRMTQIIDGGYPRIMKAIWA